ncbi:hypothetical protein Zmor_011169 [Zophobas morio]|uniref:Polyprenal reductase n=1 Tax=Zophobas morio TaxID=2755281 RepID=A0AA38MK74_9CUCU|nr:hypothetical protein Zmor_026636 [Zophobas morio]KAJ3659481.1 hypothetical protein Zmor_011169 [Zophobas morio]
MVLLGTLINIFEPYLPVIIIKTFRYGKFASEGKSALVTNVELPKSYFKHFYLTSAFIYSPIAIYEIVRVFILHGEVSDWHKAILNISCGSERVATISALRVVIATVLLVLQVFRRFHDTHFVSVFSKSATINLGHYLVGMAYYPAVFLIIFSEAPKFAIPFSNDQSNVHLHHLGIMEMCAIILFLWAWYHQYVTSKILGNLRKNTKGDVVSQSYKIPEGDWFNYLSSPHSVAEIIMYTALTLLLANNTGWWYVYAWVLSNQVETILLSHWWYQSHFKNFPVTRKALIPFIY